MAKNADVDATRADGLHVYLGPRTNIKTENDTISSEEEPLVWVPNKFTPMEKK